MPNTKEKLIELLNEADELVKELCGGLNDNHGNGPRADHLIANGVTVQQWISVKDRLPDKMGKYVCRYVFGEEEGYPFEQVLWYYPQLEKPHFQHEGSMGMRVTHWMPLPQPPKGE